MSKIRVTSGQHSGHGTYLAGSLRRTVTTVSLQVEIAYPKHPDMDRYDAIPDTKMVRLKAVPDMSVYHSDPKQRGTIYVPDETYDAANAEDSPVPPGKQVIDIEMTPEQFGELLCRNGSTTDCTIRSLYDGRHWYREEVEEPGTVSDRLRERLRTANVGARKRVADLVEYVQSLSGISETRKSEIRKHASMILEAMGGNVAFAASLAAEEVSKIAEAAVHLIEDKAATTAAMRASIGPGGRVEALPESTPNPERKP